MRSGVTVVDPQTTWVDVTATVEADAVSQIMWIMNPAKLDAIGPAGG